MESKSVTAETLKKMVADNVKKGMTAQEAVDAAERGQSSKRQRKQTPRMDPSKL